MNAVNALLVRIARQEALLNLVGRTAAGWVDYPSRTSDGIAVAGEVTRITSVGRFWDTELALSSRPEETIHVINDVPPQLDPRLPYDVGSQLVLLGSIIDDPGHELPDYPGSGPVVWHGIHLPTYDPTATTTSVPPAE